MNSPETLARVLFFLAPAFWTVNYLVARWAPGEAAPHILALGRWSIAIVLMALVFSAPFRRQWPEFKIEVRRYWPRFVLLGALGMWVCGAILYLGGRSTSSFNMALIYSLSPLLISWASIHLLHERLDTFQRFGLGLSALGVLLVICKGDLNNLLRVEFVAGDLWVLLAALSWSVYAMLLKYWPSALSPQIRLIAITGGGIMVLLPFTVLEFFLWKQDAWLTAQGGGLMLLAAVFPGVLAYQSYSFVLQKLGAARTSSMVHLSTVYAAFAGWLVLGEKLYWYHLLGIVLVVPGVFLVSRSAKKA